MRKNLDDECIICFEPNVNQVCILFDCCDKYIHKQCIDNWISNDYFIRNKSCIFCMKSNQYIDNYIIDNSQNHISINERVDSNNRQPINFCIRIINNLNSNQYIMIFGIVLLIVMLSYAITLAVLLS